MNEKKLINLEVKPELYKRLKHACIDKNLTLRQAIEPVIEEWVEKVEKENT